MTGAVTPRRTRVRRPRGRRSVASPGASRVSRLYAGVDPRLGRVEYRDRKRWWWLLSLAYPLLPFAGMAAHAASGREIALGLPLLVSYGLMPLLDLLLGEDRNNPPEAVVAQLEEDRH